MTKVAPVKLKSMSLEELIKLAADLKKEIAKRKYQAKKTAAAMAGPIALCRAAGLTEEAIEALIANGSPRVATKAAEKVALSRYRGDS